MDEYVYKVLTMRQWEQFQDDGEFAGSPHDKRDGFIHLSARHQVAGVIERYFADQPQVTLLEIDLEGEKLLRWEASSKGEEYPHLYRALRIDEVVDSETVHVHH
ncbi:MAG: hypothetical protein CL675_02265 [Bdellovibrionaceae bacterium]|nr:hypothetical protein [Pseudobdellovibrionaceae bacterium]